VTDDITAMDVLALARSLTGGAGARREGDATRVSGSSARLADGDGAGRAVTGVDLPSRR
jgi:hypothetical protein